MCEIALKHSWAILGNVERVLGHIEPILSPIANNLSENVTFVNTSKITKNG